MKIGGIEIQMPGESGKTTAESLADLLQSILDALDHTAESLGETFGIMKKDTKGVDMFAKALTKLADSALKKTNGSLKRAVMGFDELNRLTKNTAYANVTQKNKEIKENLNEMLEDMESFGEKVEETILDPVTQWGKDTLGGIVDRFAGVFPNGLFGDNADMQEHNRLWGQLNQQTSMWSFLTEDAQKSAEKLRAELERAGVIGYDFSGVLKTMGEDTNHLSTQMTGVGTAAQAGWQGIQTAFGQSGKWFEDYVATPVNNSFDGLWKAVSADAQSGWEGTKGVFSDAGGFFESTFSDAWGKVNNVFSQDGQVSANIKEGVLAGFKKAVNGLVDGINSVVANPFKGLNDVLSKIQAIKIGNLYPFAALSWRAQVPQIPHLARGAVLPANKPFLAVVGDQRHGTNVETPLSTIQEAVAAVMEDYTNANMAGHSATVDVLRQILEAVLGIHISDEVIATAYDRYHRHMGIVSGR